MSCCRPGCRICLSRVRNRPASPSTPAVSGISPVTGMSGRHVFHIARRTRAATLRRGRTHQPGEGFAIVTCQIGHVARINPEEHFRVGMSQGPCDPLRVLTGSQHQRGRSVPGLVRPARSQPQVTQQRVPDPVGEVDQIDRLTVALGEHSAATFGHPLALFEQGHTYQRNHRDIPHRAVGLGALQPPLHDRLAH